MMNSFNSKSQLKIGDKSYTIYRLSALKKDLSRLPFSIRILLENLLRNEDGVNVKAEDIEALAKWGQVGARPLPGPVNNKEIAFTPARVILQDFTGVPCVVDLAAMRDQIKKMGGDPQKINPLQPVDLVIDHSVQVDAFGSPEAFHQNVEKEYGRNLERYQFLRWGQQAFHNFRAVPPGTGIVHQVNLEYLASLVVIRPLSFPSSPLRGEGQGEGEILAYPDTLVGTDSHTTMINGLGVLGWGVGGIEAEAAMLGQPISMLIPEVVGFKISGTLQEGVTATDLVLTVTQMLRKKGVVGKFVEFFGPGLASLPLADRATIANMAPEYGATIGIFPVDQQTLDYLKLTGRPKELIQLVDAYYKAQGLFGADDCIYSESLELDLSTVETSLAGPKRPQDRVALPEVKTSFRKALLEMVKPKGPELDPKRIQNWVGEGGNPQAAKVEIAEADYGALSQTATIESKNGSYEIGHGSVVIAAITSCTNTSNPAVMLGAGLLAKKAVERGLQVKPWVKTSLAPGSKVVMDYLKEAGVLPYLEKLGFYLVGFGCTTCIGNSGPLPPEISAAIKEHDLIAAAVLSGNRNFEGRINPFVKANYLASPPLVVAYALAGSIDKHLTLDPIGRDPQGQPVFLKDIWPTRNEIQEAMAKVKTGMFENQYGNVFEGDAAWKAIRVSAGSTFVWDPKSTYVRKPPYFDAMPDQPVLLQNIRNARVLAVLGDSVTTDHISPAGNIAKDSPAAKYLMANGVEVKDFNSYGARRGNHEVMMRGTFANIRLKNFLLPEVEGPYTKCFIDGQTYPIYDAAVQYQDQKVPLIILAGKEYGSGSSRDWAAKGPALLGVKAVIAESFERIHRSNLIGMGILPLEFLAGDTRTALSLTGEEIYSVDGIAEKLLPAKVLKVTAQKSGGKKEFYVKCRIDTPVELAYYQHGGILQYVLRQLSK